LKSLCDQHLVAGVLAILVIIDPVTPFFSIVLRDISSENRFGSCGACVQTDRYGADEKDPIEPAEFVTEAHS
jgi:hypothetical protein